MSGKTLSRTRTGCHQCRQKRVKCDGCDYGLRLTWEEDALALNKSHGRAKHKPYQYVAHHDRTPSQDSASPASPSNSNIIALDAESHLISYFKNVCCPQAVLVDDDQHNPLRGVMLPVALASNVGRSALAMLAAHFLATSDERYKTVELHMRQTTLQLLREALASNQYDDDMVLMLALMLCSSDIMNNRSNDWMAHLICYRDTLAATVRERSLAARSTRTYLFFSAYFSLHTVLAKTIYPIDADFAAFNSTQQTLLASSWTASESLALLMPEDDMDIVDTWTGFSNSLMLLLNEMTALRDQSAMLNDLKSTSEREQLRLPLFDHIRRLARSVTSLDQRPPPSLAENQEHAKPLSLLMATAEAYRIASLLYLAEIARFVIAQCKPPEVDGEAGVDTQQLFQMIEGFSACTSSLLDQVALSLTHTHVPPSWPLWPLFIAGCVAESDETRREVAGLFTKAQDLSQWENITPAWTVVQAVWEKRSARSSSAKQPPERDERQARFVCAWEEVVSLEKAGLSLA
ncbi:hypothetical protein PRZ48_007182 [Zasmidium cellare]|uniref:Zn(2)-C6 fungal-type domain-containing protein n=1 Tax=Zasmidium cellare TaxID=395010 RepID=A0ABR0EJ23_ZASCE|nr:hypothetical protein PRZ48_007182 [Zasmidium cellare]